MKYSVKRSGMSMIELIFAIVIMAIVILSIPAMMSVADQATKKAAIDDDVLSRLSGWVLEKSQARWDQNYSASGSPIIHIAGNLGCDTNRSGIWYRDNNDSMVQCSDTNLTPAMIPNLGDGNLSKGIEQLNGGTEKIILSTMYDVNATYNVRYVPSLASVNGNRATATWKLGTSVTMAPDGTLNTPTHLKRVVTRFYNPDLELDMTLTYFKSNKGN